MSRYKYKIKKPWNMTDEIYDIITNDDGEVPIENIMDFIVGAFNHTLGYGFGDPSCFTQALCNEYGDIPVITVIDIIELFYHNQIAPIVIEDASEFETKYIWMSENEEMRHGFISDISEEYRNRYIDLKDLMEIEDEYKIVTVRANVVVETFTDKPPMLCHKLTVVKRNTSEAFMLNSLSIIKLISLFNFLKNDSKIKEEYRRHDIIFTEGIKYSGM